MRMKTICIHHDDDDGFGAAWVVRRAHELEERGHELEFFPTNYGYAPPDVRGKSVYIVDFSYKREVMQNIMADCFYLTVLDHHKTAQAELDGLSDPADPQRVHIQFEQGKSGVRMAWEHFFQNEPEPELISYLDAGDLWQLDRHPDLKQVQAALRSYPYDFALWDGFMAPTGMKQLRAEGGAIKRYIDQQIGKLVKLQRPMMIGGFEVPAVNTSFHQSEVAGALAEQGSQFGCCYFDAPDKRIFSLRSRGDFDVSEVAKKFGGGGHKNAAGFCAPRS